jgi:hypothetical protein
VEIQVSGDEGWDSIKLDNLNTFLQASVQ